MIAAVARVLFSVEDALLLADPRTRLRFAARISPPVGSTAFGGDDGEGADALPPAMLAGFDQVPAPPVGGWVEGPEVAQWLRSTLDDVHRSVARAERWTRLQCNAALEAAPDTLCDATQIAGLFGIREGLARTLRPAGAWQLGQRIVAPYADWKAAVVCHLRGAPGAGLKAAEASTPRRSARSAGAAGPPTIPPLGGPRRT